MKRLLEVGPLRKRGALADSYTADFNSPAVHPLELELPWMHLHVMVVQPA